jgi:hypothetical protein
MSLKDSEEANIFINEYLSNISDEQRTEPSNYRKTMIKQLSKYERTSTTPVIKDRIINIVKMFELGLLEWKTDCRKPYIKIN